MRLRTFNKGKEPQVRTRSAMEVDSQADSVFETPSVKNVMNNNTPVQENNNRASYKFTEFSPQ